MATLPLTREPFYVDTTPGNAGLFAPAEPVADYAAWLAARDKAGQSRDGEQVICCGVAQVLNQLIYRDRREGGEVVCIGPYRDQFLDYIMLRAAAN